MKQHLEAIINEIENSNVYDKEILNKLFHTLNKMNKDTKYLNSILQLKLTDLQNKISSISIKNKELSTFSKKSFKTIQNAFNTATTIFEELEDLLEKCQKIEEEIQEIQEDIYYIKKNIYIKYPFLYQKSKIDTKNMLINSTKNIDQIKHLQLTILIDKSKYSDYILTYNNTQKFNQYEKEIKTLKSDLTLHDQNTLTLMCIFLSIFVLISVNVSFFSGIQNLEPLSVLFLVCIINISLVISILTLLFGIKVILMNKKGEFYSILGSIFIFRLYRNFKKNKKQASRKK